MPELPEVETVRHGLNRVTLSQPIEGGDVLLDRTIAHPFSGDAFVKHLSGLAIAHWHRRGKYLLAELFDPGATPAQGRVREPAGWLGVHLRMTGQLLWLPQAAPVEKHCRVRLFFPHGQELRFVDQRTFGQMWWVPSGVAPEVIIQGLTRLGPEPLSNDFSVDYLKRQLINRRRPIKTALLDQAIVAGIGNIYADEALFLSGISPLNHCNSLKPPQVRRLHKTIIQVLQDSIVEGGTTFSNFRDVQGVNGNYGNVAWVYGREGQPCRVCQTSIERLKLAGRSTYFCRTCQR
ncbi:MAG: DNA-formamidopyrimidine glycosylase [Elainellaceae cyanobacterium]